MTPEQRWAVQRDRIERSRVWLLPAAVWEILLGAGTIRGYAGHPEDAPHLHIPEVLRGWAWIVLGLVALVVLVGDHRRTEERTRIGAAALLVMPLVRAVSYSWAWWVYALGEDVGRVASWYQEGSPSAWYACVPWWLISWAILSQAVAWRRLCGAVSAAIRRKLGKVRGHDARGE